jgi:hypothetical protein
VSKVVEMDFERILTRLRSKHAERSKKTDKKTPLITQLKVALEESSSVFRQGLDETGSNKVVALQVLFEKLQSMSGMDARGIHGQEVICNIVKEAHEFTLATDLDTALEHSKIEPSLKEYLPGAIAKVGRYYTAARELVNIARDETLHVFDKVHVESFPILVPPFDEKLPQRTELLSLPRELALLSMNRRNEVVNSLQERMTRIAGGRAVHAEIQLLFFYELHPELPRPRIICSNKKACYLCNLFLKIHGGFCIPKTHGRIYDRWILPDWLKIPAGQHQKLGIILKLFKDTLDDRVGEAFTSEVKPYNHPDESILHSAGDYCSTITSASPAQGSQTSTSTVFQAFPPAKEANLDEQQHQGAELSVQPEKAPIATLVPARHPKTILENPASPASDSISLVTVKTQNLPYSQIVTLATPSLYVRVDTLFITLEFAEALSGRLFITKRGELGPSKTIRVVDINEIPTTSELEVHCSRESNAIQVLLQIQGTEIIYIRFVWDDAH